MDERTTPTTDTIGHFRAGVSPSVKPVEFRDTEIGAPPRYVMHEGRLDDRRGEQLRLVALLFVLVAAGLLAALMDFSSIGERLQSARGAGLAGVGAFVLVFAGGTLGPLPRNVLSTAAGTIFGFWWGLPLAYLGSLLGAGMAFGLARRLGQDATRRFRGARTAEFRASAMHWGFLTVLVARLAPFVPFTGFNYAAGLTDIRWRTYWLGTLVGVVPGTVLYVAVGAYAFAPGSWTFGLPAGALLLLGVVYAVHRRTRIPRSILDASR